MVTISYKRLDNGRFEVSVDGEKFTGELNECARWVSRVVSQKLTGKPKL